MIMNTKKEKRLTKAQLKNRRKVEKDLLLPRDALKKERIADDQRERSQLETERKLKGMNCCHLWHHFLNW